MDPISVAAGGVAIGQGTMASIEFLWSRVRTPDVIAALFDPDAQRLTGDERMQVQVLRPEGWPEEAWWYRAVGIAGFEFIPYATSPYLEIRVASTQDAPRNRIWRWVWPAHPGSVYGDRTKIPTVETNFVLVGYRPEAIVRHFAPGRRR